MSSLGLSLGHYLETSRLIICGQYIIWYQPNCWPGYVYLMQIDIGQSSSFLWWFSPFLETYVPSQIPCFFEKKLPQKTKNIPKKIKILSQLPTIWKGAQGFLLPNLAKYTYGKSSLEQHLKIEGKNIWWVH
jgi:hypothetical protein